MHIECKCIANQSEITEPNCFTPRFASVYANGKSFSERKKKPADVRKRDSISMRGLCKGCNITRHAVLGK